MKRDLSLAAIIAATALVTAFPAMAQNVTTLTEPSMDTTVLTSNPTGNLVQNWDFSGPTFQLSPNWKVDNQTYNGAYGGSVAPQALKPLGITDTFAYPNTAGTTLYQNNVFTNMGDTYNIYMDVDNYWSLPSGSISITVGQEALNTAGNALNIAANSPEYQFNVTQTGWQELEIQGLTAQAVGNLNSSVLAISSNSYYAITDVAVIDTTIDTTIESSGGVSGGVGGAVPEASTYLMGLIGVFGLGALSFRKRLDA